MHRIIIVLLIFITGCLSPRHISEKDLYLSQYVLESHYLEIYKRLNAGFQVCRENFIETDIDEDKKIAFINIYERNPGLGRNKPLKGIGWIEVEFKSKFLTEVRIGANRHIEENLYGRERALTRRWLRWASGAEVRSCVDSQFPQTLPSQ
jgi:hypothetical protein